jgi:hypothetical protein
MRRRFRFSLAVALVGAIALSLLEIDLALVGAGPYKAMRQVQIGSSIGIGFAYFFVLWLLALATHSMSALTVPIARNVALVLLVVVSACAALASPLVPALLLAASCQIRLLCPEAANPILWSYLHVVTQLPLAPLAVGALLVVVSALLSRSGLASNNGV